MRLKTYIFAIAFLIFQFGNSQSNYYYYYNNQKVYINLDKEYIAINSSVNTTFLENYSTNYISKTDFIESNVRSYTIPKDTIAQSRVALKNYYTEIKATNAIKNNIQNYDNFISVLSINSNIIKVSPCFIYQEKRLGLTNNFYVKLKSLSDETLLYNYVQSNNLEVIGNDPYSPEWYVISCTKQNALNALEYANQFHESGIFESAEPEFTYHDLQSSTDPFFSDQWGLKNTGQYGSAYEGIDIKAEQAWTITKGNNIKVAVYDDGFELNHPDLQQNVSGNGFDVMTGGDSQVRGDHGTACAGIIGAVQNNNIGISGVAPEAKLISISMELETTTTGLQIKSGFDWAVQNNIDVISCSWGGLGQSNYIETGISNALNNGRNYKGCVVVFATGNNGFNNNSITYPGNSLPNILTVGAITPCGERKTASTIACQNDPYALWASSYGTQLDVVAPGLKIATTDRQVNNGYNPHPFFSYPDYTDKNYHKSFSGTSAAAPHVAGIAALILAVNSQLTAIQVNTIIEQTAQKIRPDLYNYENHSNRPNGSWHEEMGYGLVDAYAAVQLAQSMATLDLMVRDSPEDLGIEPNIITEYPWASPDIWIRNQDDNGLTHQNPEYSPTVPNWAYIRITNKSLVASSGNEQLKFYWAKAGTSLNWSSVWTGQDTFQNGALMGNEVGSVNIPVIQPGQTKIVKMPFYAPNPSDYSFAGSDQWHFCLLARIDTTNDQMTFPETTDLVSNVLNNNNIAWKNITIVNVVPDSEGKVGGVIAVGNPFDEIRAFNLNFEADNRETGKLIFEEAEVTVHLDDILLNAWENGGKQGNNIISRNGNTLIVTGDNASLNNLIFDKNETGTLFLQFNFLTKEITGKEIYKYNVIQRHTATNSIFGGETYEIRKNPRELFYADAGDDKYIDKNETTILSAESINEPAVYNWYDSDGNLIYEGADFEVSVEVAKKYKLEIIALSDGYKDYTEIEVKINPNRIETVYPNPSSNLVTTTYKINNGDSAYLSLTGFYGSTISNNYILDIAQNEIAIDISSYPQGLYTIALIVNGQIADTKTLVKQ